MNIFDQPLETLIEQILVFIPKLIAALVIFLVALWVAGLVAKTIRDVSLRREIAPELATLFSRVGRWSVIILGTIWALDMVNFNVTAFVAGLGIVGFTVGFALQDIAKNFVAGILLLLQRPFEIGQAIQVAGHSGTVTEVSLRATEIRTLDGLQVFIPNADVYTNALTNYSRATQRRITLQVGVAYGTDLDQATQVALAAVSQVPGVIGDDPEPVVVFDSFGDSSINFSLYYWIDLDQISYFAGQDQGLKAVNRAFEREGIEIPFPIRVLHLRQENGNATPVPGPEIS